MISEDAAAQLANELLFHDGRERAPGAWLLADVERRDADKRWTRPQVILEGTCSGRSAGINRQSVAKEEVAR